MKKPICNVAAILLGTAFLLFSTPVFAEDYTPLGIESGGTGSTTIEEAKENLEIPDVVQSAGQSETVVMSQKAVADLVASGSGGGIVVTQVTGQSTTDVMSQKAVTDAINSVQTPIVQTTGQSTLNVMSQKAVTDALESVAQNTIVQTTGQSTTEVMSQKAVTDTINSIPQINIVHKIGQSVDSVMSQKAVTEAILTAQNIFNMIYPIDSIYMSVNSVNPSTLFGGTWVSWGAGRVPVGVNSSDSDFSTTEKTGGTKTVTLTESQMPKHSHKILRGRWFGSDPTIGSSGSIFNQTSTTTAYGGDSETWGDRQVIYDAGNNQPHNNIQPYITCYMFKRIA